MPMVNLLFFFFSLTALLGAIYILFSKSLIHAAFALLASFLSVAAILIIAGADFVGISQIMVYVGGILVLILFGIMMTYKIALPNIHTTFIHKLMGIVAGMVTFALLVAILFKANFAAVPWIAAAEKSGQTVSGSTIASIGIKLMSSYILPFELAALILTGALIGASFIAINAVRKKPK